MRPWGEFEVTAKIWKLAWNARRTPFWVFGKMFFFTLSHNKFLLSYEGYLGMGCERQQLHEKRAEILDLKRRHFHSRTCIQAVREVYQEDKSDLTMLFILLENNYVPQICFHVFKTSAWKAERIPLLHKNKLCFLIWITPIQKSCNVM